MRVIHRDECKKSYASPSCDSYDQFYESARRPVVPRFRKHHDIVDKQTFRS